MLAMCYVCNTPKVSFRIEERILQFGLMQFV